MFIHIGKKIEALRTARKIPADKFAAYLGVETAALSDWESGKSYPPLECIPAIADYFRVSTDELLCMDQYSNEEKLDEYMTRFEDCLKKGKKLLAVETVREALMHYPENYRFKCMLLYALYLNCDRKNAVRFSSAEMLALGEDILDHCTDDDLRIEARRLLALHYFNNLHDGENAVRMAQSMPDRMLSRQEMLPLVTEGKDRLQCCEANVAAYAQLLIRAVKRCAEDGDYTASQKLSFYAMTLQLARQIFPDGDYLALSAELFDTCRSMAALCMSIGEQDKALEALEAAARFALEFEKMPRSARHTSPLVSLVSSRRSDAGDEFLKKKPTETLLREMLELSCFEPLRYDDRLKKICDTLRGE